MIKVFTSFLVVTLALGGCIYAQDTLKIGKTRVKILDDIPFYLNGTLINDDSTIFNSGNIYLKGNIINNHTSELFTQGEAGIVRFLGDTLQQVSGNPVFFNKIQLNKDSILLLNTNIRLSDSVILVKGNIDLNGNTLYLDNSSLALNGIITPESDVSRIYGSAGYVYTNMPLNDFLINGLNLGLLISGVSGGDIRVERYHIPELTVTDGSINKYFNLYPQNAGQSANAEFHYLDPIDLVNVNCTEADFKIWSSYCNGVYYENKYGVVDASGNFAHTTSSPIVIQNPTRLTVADEICDSPPVINLGPDTIYICKGNIAVLDAGNTGSDFIWNTSEATQEISVSTSGKYSVMVTDQRGCFSTDSIVVMVDSLPVIDNIFVSVSPQCISETFTFSNASHINPLDSISGFLWEFGDGVTSSDSLAVHIYQGTGTYSAQLTVYSGDGCAVSETHNVTVLPLPNVSFSFSNACLDDTVNFLNTTPGGIFSSDWDLGNGIQSSAHDTICAYHTEGTYTVSLVVMNSFGCVDSVSQSIEIYAPGVAGFTTDDANVCLGASSVFHNNSTSPSGSLTYTWDFGNGLNSATANPIIAYSSAGTYIVTLIASTGMGCKDTVVHQVEIFSVPDAAFSFNEVCLGDTTYFTNLTTIFPVETLDYYWETGDGANNTNENFGYLYDQQGSYNVALTATSTHGCFSSVNHQVNVHPNPAANFFCTAVCQGEASFFNNVSYPDDGSLSVLWDFGDGNSSFEQDPYHTYSADGSYMVTLSVETGFGCTDSIEKPVVVHPLPVVDLGDTIYHCDDSYILNADNPGDSYLWSNNA
ncbi:MAG: PKD domain-containing protein, partial [Bacteroidota bacterium]